MAIGVDEIRTVGRLIFNLRRGDEETTRTIDIAYPITDPEDPQTLQNAVNAANTTYTSGTMALFIQPANWRDSNATEEQWTTTGVHYEIVTTVTRPITPDTNS